MKNRILVPIILSSRLVGTIQGMAKIVIGVQVAGGGMYNTIPAAYERVKEDLNRAVENKCDLSKIKFVVKKIVTTESVEEELTGTDFTAFMLKTA